MHCEIISIGDELLIGQVVNTNAAWMGRELTGIGLNVELVTTIPDHKEVIIDHINRAIDRSVWAFVTGGLGPTKDDVTKEALLRIFGGELVFHEETWMQLGKIYALYGKSLSDAHRQQCYLPSSALVLPNRMGTAPGLLFNSGSCTVCVMPGVPFEMEYIMQTHILPRIRSQVDDGAIYHRTIATVGEGESVLAEAIADIEDNLPSHIRLAYLPAPGRVRIRVIGHGSDAPSVIAMVDAVTEQIASRISKFVYAIEDISLAEAIGRHLRGQGKTLSVAESCTGGFLGHLITSVASSSDYFLGGAITYSNQLKQSVLGVKVETLKKYGAVSEQTVCEMAEGAVKSFDSDFAIAVSGIAGPSGGTTDRPVGTVWIGLADRSAVIAKKYVFGKDRIRNIEMSAVYALDMLRYRLGHPIDGG